jgi:hypothetical protein
MTETANCLWVINTLLLQVEALLVSKLMEIEIGASLSKVGTVCQTYFTLRCSHRYGFLRLTVRIILPVEICTFSGFATKGSWWCSYLELIIQENIACYQFSSGRCFCGNGGWSVHELRVWNNKLLVTDPSFSFNPHSFHRCIGKECSECIDAKGPRANLALRWHGKPDNWGL